MSSAAEEAANEEIDADISRFSAEAFGLAKAFLAGDHDDALRESASGLRAKLPDVAARMQEADEPYRAGMNRALSEARLDLDYVLAGGELPTSLRLGHVIREQAAGGNDGGPATEQTDG